MGKKGGHEGKIKRLHIPILFLWLKASFSISYLAGNLENKEQMCLH